MWGLQGGIEKENLGSAWQELSLPIELSGLLKKILVLCCFLKSVGISPFKVILG